MTVGAALTVNALASEAVPSSAFVTVTARGPVAAPASIEIIAVSSVEELRVVDSTVIPVPNEELTPL